MSTAPAPRRPSARPTPGRFARPPLRLVGPAPRARRFLAVLVFLGAFGVFGSVALNALAAEEAFAARALEAEVSELEMRYEELIASVAELESPERIRAVATEDLGMVPASGTVYLVDQDGASIRAVYAEAGDAGTRSD